MTSTNKKDTWLKTRVRRGCKPFLPEATIVLWERTLTNTGRRTVDNERKKERNWFIPFVFLSNVDHNI